MYNPNLPNNGLGLYPNVYGGYAGPQTSGVINTNPVPQQVQIPRVHGEDGARAYNLGPNSSILLLDETDNVIWCKATDSAGFATLNGYRISQIEKHETPTIENTEYASKKDFDGLKARFDKLMEDLNGKSNS